MNTSTLTRPACFMSALLCLAGMTGTAHAAARSGVGVGVVLGEPTGVSVAWGATERRAFQSHLSWSVVSDRARLSADYLQTITTLTPSGSAARLPVYVGLGGVIGVDDSAWVGARVPLGIALIPAQAPLEVFAELAPTFYLIPATTGGLEGALGLRLYF